MKYHLEMGASGRSLFEKSSAKTFRLPPPFLSTPAGLKEKEAACSLNQLHMMWQQRYGRRMVFNACLSNFSKVWPPAGPPEAFSPRNITMGGHHEKMD